VVIGLSGPTNRPKGRAAGLAGSGGNQTKMIPGHKEKTGAEALELFFILE
jgi:hypothetical protein